MNWKIFVSLLAGFLGICCGEAVKLEYTQWSQLTSLTYWLGIGFQTAGLLTVWVGGVYTNRKDQAPGHAWRTDSVDDKG